MAAADDAYDVRYEKPVSRSLCVWKVNVRVWRYEWRPSLTVSQGVDSSWWEKENALHGSAAQQTRAGCQ